MKGSVDVYFDAPPAVVWDLISDVTRIGEFSPETFEAKWNKGSTGPEKGAYFKGHVKRNGSGVTYWTQCVVTHYEIERDFGFSVVAGGQTINTWRYQLAPEGAGTRVTESYALAPSLPTRIYWLFAGWLRGRSNERDMRATLERMKAVAERDAG